MSGTSSSSREAARIAAVRRYDILDSPPDGAFDRITALAARRFAVPIAIISIVDADRIWFKSHHGLPVHQIDREPGLCASAILGDTPYLIEDARKDPRSLANPLVAGDFGLRFYAAVPLTTDDGHNLGTLCVIDKEPRPIEPDQIEDLKDLASIVMDQLELGLSARHAVGKANLMAKEIDHRVMNSLQFVSGLLSMQSRSLGEGRAAVHLELAAQRVAAVAQVHRHFYAGAAVEVSCVDYLRRLCGDLASILDREVVVEGDEEMVPAASIQSIGLITNELVTNAAKHGAGRIEVGFRVSGNTNRLIVCDEGCGLPSGFDPLSANTGLGMRVITTLVKQIKGTVEAGPRAGGIGACFTVQFPRAA
ncbi:GAF domain-containing protein [Sphingomonas lutea]|uniref:histidine kinase n=1 Tax=Sphingomonas lutea TaxID=1045317 RepID=A0A7G9SGC0_9SPHN|nr:histidine kinase dimerization/phosphoacceptor domain -containing protein [Sphingomonas lutea]QNN66895.1 GAF domain-containing protein [Sphingomonas lutea]